MNLSARNGFLLAVGAAILCAGSSVLSAYGLHSIQEDTGLEGVFLRVLVNMGLVLLVNASHRKKPSSLLGDGSFELFLWGLLGALTIITYFISLGEIGPGETTLLQGFQGIVIVTCSAFFFRRRVGTLAWLAVFGGFLGMVLAVSPSSAGANWAGRLWALSSGTCAGCAYLVLAHSRKKFSPGIVSFYWCAASFIAVGALALYSGHRITISNEAFPWFLAAGLLASVAQWITTIAYQVAPAPLVGAAAYLIPVFGFSWEICFQGKELGWQLAAGTCLVVICGAALPLFELARVRESVAYAN